MKKVITFFGIKKREITPFYFKLFLDVIRLNKLQKKIDKLKQIVYNNIVIKRDYKLKRKRGYQNVSSIRKS